MLLRVRWDFLVKLDDLTVGNRSLHLDHCACAVYDDCVPQVMRTSHELHFHERES